MWVKKFVDLVEYFFQTISKNTRKDIILLIEVWHFEIYAQNKQ